MSTNNLQDDLDATLSSFIKDRDESHQMHFVKLVNTNGDIGAHIALKLLSHKVQSPSKVEALAAVDLLDACSTKCGNIFLEEMGKFRFLNELIKVVSPKYFGKYTPEDVKCAVVRFFEDCVYRFPMATKIKQAFDLIKQQDLIPPTYSSPHTFPPPPPPKVKLSTLDEEKSLLLKSLLSSSRPEDLQSANRLIKTMVQQDAEKTDRIAKRQTALEIVDTSVAVVRDLINSLEAGRASEQEIELLDELVEQLERQRPVLFRLASEFEGQDDEDINAVLQANDQVQSVIISYNTCRPRRKVEQTTRETTTSSRREEQRPPAAVATSTSKPTDSISRSSAGSQEAADVDALLDLSFTPTEQSDEIRPTETDDHHRVRDLLSDVPGDNATDFLKHDLVAFGLNESEAAASAMNGALISDYLSEEQLLKSLGKKQTDEDEKLTISRRKKEEKRETSLDLLWSQSLSSQAKTVNNEEAKTELKPDESVRTVEDVETKTEPIPPTNNVETESENGVKDQISFSTLKVELSELKIGSKPAQLANIQNVCVMLTRASTEGHGLPSTIRIFLLSAISTNSSHSVEDFKFKLKKSDQFTWRCEAPSATCLPRFSPVLPPPTLTQIIYIDSATSSSSQSISYNLSFVIDDDLIALVDTIDLSKCQLS